MSNKILLLSNILCIDGAGSRFERLSQVLGNPITEVYLAFYLSALQAFVKFNQFLQRDDPLIPILLPQTVSFLKKLAGKFLLVSVIKDADGTSMGQVDYTDVQNQLSGVYNIIQ